MNLFFFSKFKVDTYFGNFCQCSLFAVQYSFIELYHFCVTHELKHAARISSVINCTKNLRHDQVKLNLVWYTRAFLCIFAPI